MNHIKIFKGQPRQFALWELAINWYETFPPDHNDQVENNNSTTVRNKKSMSTTQSYAEDQILEKKILGARF